jgi:hypothetical protein
MSRPHVCTREDLHRDHLHARLDRALAQLGADEVLVVTVVAERLVAGARHYGALRLEADPRDFRREAGDEVLDACAYLAMALVRGDAAVPSPEAARR